MANTWQIGGFVKNSTTILESDANLVFQCPWRKETGRWAEKDVFNPGAAVVDGRVALLVRCEDVSGPCTGTSRIGLAFSDDGLRFAMESRPVIYPDRDASFGHEHGFGCQDPRVTLRDDGTWICTYSSFNGVICTLSVATSRDFRTWDKRGRAFGNTTWENQWAKSGCIVSCWEGDHLLATKIDGKYWMYWGEGLLHAATSDDCISWIPMTYTSSEQPLVLWNSDTRIRMGRTPSILTSLRPIAFPRPKHFDASLIEPGPAAVIGRSGIVLWYNGAAWTDSGRYCCGQILLDGDNPCQIQEWPRQPYLEPDRPWEFSGQFGNSATFSEGLVRFGGKLLLYYGCADRCVNVAVASNPTSG